MIRDRIPAGPTQQSFVFAVQGRDDGGAITPQFDRTTSLANNYAAIVLDGSLLVGPRITVHSQEDTLSSWTFLGVGAPSIVVNTAEDTLHLFWDAPRANHYGARGRDCRYGWNIVNANDDNEWTSFSTSRTATPHAVASGDIFDIQCRDDIGQTTSGRIFFQRVAPFARKDFIPGDG